MTEAQLLDASPSLRAADLVDARACVAAHADEVDRRIRGNEES